MIFDEPSEPINVFAVATPGLQGLLDSDPLLSNAFDAFGYGYTPAEYAGLLETEQKNHLCDAKRLVDNLGDETEFADFLANVCPNDWSTACPPGQRSDPQLGCIDLNYLSPCGDGLGYFDTKGQCVYCPWGQVYDKVAQQCVKGCLPGMTPNAKWGCTAPGYNSPCSKDGNKGIIEADGVCYEDTCPPGYRADLENDQCIPASGPPPVTSCSDPDTEPYWDEESTSWKCVPRCGLNRVRQVDGSCGCAPGTIEQNGQCVQTEAPTPSCAEFGEGYQPFWDEDNQEWGCASCGENESLSPEGWCVCKGGYARKNPSDPSSPCEPEGPDSQQYAQEGGFGPPAKKPPTIKYGVNVGDPTPTRPPCAPPNVPDPYGSKDCIAPDEAARRSQLLSSCVAAGGTFDTTTEVCTPPQDVPVPPTSGDGEASSSSNTALMIGVGLVALVGIGALVFSSSSAAAAPASPPPPQPPQPPRSPNPAGRLVGVREAPRASRISSITIHGTDRDPPYLQGRTFTGPSSLNDAASYLNSYLRGLHDGDDFQRSILASVVWENGTRAEVEFAYGPKIRSPGALLERIVLSIAMDAGLTPMWMSKEHYAAWLREQDRLHPERRAQSLRTLSSLGMVR